MVAAPAPPPWGYAPAAPASTVKTGGIFPSRTVPRASLGWAEEVEVYELDNLGFADGLSSLTKEVVVYGRYDLALVNHAVVVGIVPENQGVSAVHHHHVLRHPHGALAGTVAVGVARRGPQVVAVIGPNWRVGGIRRPGDVVPSGCHVHGSGPLPCGAGGCRRQGRSGSPSARYQP